MLSFAHNASRTCLAPVNVIKLEFYCYLITYISCFKLHFILWITQNIRYLSRLSVQMKILMLLFSENIHVYYVVSTLHH